MLNKGHYCFRMIFWSLLFVAQIAGAQNLANDSIPVVVNDSIVVAAADTVEVKTDSVKPSAIEAPIKSHAKDSIVLVLEGKNMFYLYGDAKVTQQARELTAEYMELDANSNLIYASYGVDSTGQEVGSPIFTEGDTQYEMKRLHFNFKTKKMYIYDVITQQGEGYITAGITKRMANEDLCMLDGKYTTCDDHDNPHFYFQMTRAKIRPGKNVVTGPAYLVVEDVPLPIAVPFAFFPFTKDYSSGVLMPTFDSEMTRGFSLQRGGYYFALSDYIDLALTGNIFTKGSWGLNAGSRYRKLYKFSGGFDANYMVTIAGDKDTKHLPNSDYSRTEDIRVSWTHTQDPKANPYSTFNTSVNFSTSQSRVNNLDQFYDVESRTQNTKSSNITYSYRHPVKPFSINTNFSISQVSRDTTLNVSFPNVTFTLSQIYPFKRKEQIGDQKWYEKIYMSYTGNLRNSSGNVKEYDFFQRNMIKDWNNGMSHSIPMSASFNLMKYITVSPSVNYGGTWYTKKVTKVYDGTRPGPESNREVPVDTTYGLFWLHNQFGGSVSVNTKLYGMYKPWALFGQWTKGVQIRHVFTPSVSFSGAPDISQWGNSYDWAHGISPAGNDTTVRYSPFQGQIFGIPGSGKSGTLSFSVNNNLEMKVPIAGTDSTRKISIIDNLSMGMSYNFLAPGDTLNWSNMSASIRLKILGQNLSFSGQFDSYYYDENGRRINKLRWGNGFGRFMGTSIGYPLTLNNDVLKKWFSKGKEENNNTSKNDTDEEDDSSFEDDEGDLSGNLNNNNTRESGSLREAKKMEGDYDDDGYLLLNIPWNLSLNYSLMYGYGTFNREKREYDYRIAQTLSLSGNITPTKGWNFSFSASYDFDNRRFGMMQCSINRKMHCWNISASIIPVGPYQSYNFMISVASSLLRDLKYSQSSNFRDRVNWGY